MKYLLPLLLVPSIIPLLSVASIPKLDLKPVTFTVETPSDDPVEKLTILGTDASQLIETIDFNLTAPEEELRFQRKASNPQVAAESIPEIKQFLQRKGQAFLEEVDLYLTQHESSKDPNVELSVSVFYHQSDGENQEVEK